MTAGNLICGFLAVLKIVEGSLERMTSSGNWIRTIETSLYLILAACIFDLLDGRLARLGGRESSFGREFDSLADVISFGVAPALLVFEIVLHDFQGDLGRMVAIIYLVCGALRLARFNVLAASNIPSASREFTGFPIPAAAGLVSSLTMLLLYFYEPAQGEGGETSAGYDLIQQQLEKGYAKFGLVALLLFLSIMMFSKFKYPSFKNINWRTERSVPKFLGVVALLGLTILYYRWMLAVIFISYLLYGFFRPFISRAIRREIEEEDEDDLESTETPEKNP